MELKDQPDGQPSDESKAPPPPPEKTGQDGSTDQGGNANAEHADGGSGGDAKTNDGASGKDAGQTPPEKAWDLANGGEKEAEDANDAAADADYFRSAGFDGDNAKPIPLGKDGFGGEHAMSADDQRALLSVLRRAGVSADKAGEAVKGIARREADRLAEQTKADADATARVWRNTQSAFGSALKRTLADADRGARALFPEDLWTEIKRVPAMALDERFLRSLAQYGRTLRDDGGGPAGSGPSAKSNRITADQWAEAWAKSSR